MHFKKGICDLSFQLLSLFNELSNFLIIDTIGASDSLFLKHKCNILFKLFFHFW